MEIIHTEPRESEEAAEIVRGLGWLLHNDQLEAGSFAGTCDTALGAGAQFHRRQFNRTVCVHGEVPVGMIALGIVGPGANAAKFCGRASHCTQTNSGLFGLKSHEYEVFRDAYVKHYFSKPKVTDEMDLFDMIATQFNAPRE